MRLGKTFAQGVIRISAVIHEKNLTTKQNQFFLEHQQVMSKFVDNPESEKCWRECGNVQN